MPGGPATADASALIGAALGAGDGYFCTYRYALTIAREHMNRLSDINRLHQVVMKGLPMSSKANPGRHNLLFATARRPGRRTGDRPFMTAGAPYKILAQAPFPLNWSSLLSKKIITNVQEVQVEQTWAKGMRCRIRAELYPSRVIGGVGQDSGRRRRYTTSHEQGAWLRRKMAAAGAHIEPHDIVIGEPENLTSPSARGVQFMASVFTADATVTDPAAFVACLTQGVGKGRAYGLGLVLTSKIA